MAPSHESGPGPTTDLLKHQPFPELAAALRSRAKVIVQTWVEQVRLVVPSVKSLPVAEVLDGLPLILERMADALASVTPEDAERLAARSPVQGVTRFQQHYDVRELVLEDRLLRRMIIEQVQGAMDRRMTLDEQVALDMGIDVMLQQAIVAFVDEQKLQLRVAAEAELKYLSFLSHDLNNNLSTITLFLQLLRRRLETSPEFAGAVKTLDDTQHAVLSTIGGMGRLLQAERLRHAGVKPKVGPIRLHDMCTAVAEPFRHQAEQKGLALAVEVPAGAGVITDAELARLALQNLIANAVKYSARGTVRVAAEQQEDGRRGGWVLLVSDEGPGIAPEHVHGIFRAFRRGEMHGQSGVGLGLAIASQAAKLLDAELTVESKLGVGSTFRLGFPPEAVESG